jgi:hypothetical protein
MERRTLTVFCLLSSAKTSFGGICGGTCALSKKMAIFLLFHRDNPYKLTEHGMGAPR